MTPGDQRPDARALWAGIAALVAATACGDPDPAGGPDPRHQSSMFREVLTHLVSSESLPVDGDWPEDFGDANYYGPGFFYRYGDASGNSAQIGIGDDSHDHNLFMVSDAVDQPVRILEGPESVLMSSLGLIEGYRHRPNEDTAALTVDFLRVLDIFGDRVDYYIDSNDIIYGPTTINGAAALLNFEYAYTIAGPATDERIAIGLDVLARGRQIAYDEALGYYRFNTGDDRLYLYPNVMQMLAHVRGYQVTGDAAMLDEALSLYEAIQPLRLEGRYRSPYSAAQMGATTDDYTTLSSQNYLMLALSQLYLASGDDRFRQEVIEILAFIESHLLSEGRVLHHWIDGEPAREDDEVTYCSGCNLQLLYLIWRLEDEFAPPAAARQ